MFNLQKDLVINSSTAYPVTIYDSSNVAVADAATAAAGSYMVIPGFGRFEFDYVSGVRGQIGRAAQPRIDTLVAGGVTFVAPSIAKTIYVKIQVNAFNAAAEFARFEMVPGEDIIYALTILPADTAATFITKLGAAALDRQTRFPEDVSVSIINNAGTLTFTGVNQFVNWTVVVEDEFDTTSTTITALSFTTTQRRFEGLQTAAFIQQNVRLLTYASTRPYGEDKGQMAIEGALYHSVTFNITKENDRVAGNSVPGQVNNTRSSFTIYVNADAATAVLANIFYNIVNFLDQADAAAVWYSNALTNGAQAGEAQASTAVASAAFLALA